MSSYDIESVRTKIAALHKQREIQEIIRKKDFLLHIVFTKEKKFVLPFSRRPINFDWEALIDEHDASLIIRLSMIDLRVDYTPPRPNKKFIRIIDET
ncbi:unnamed protein product [Adineta ricciae]|uniref:Uncharacterized protein n=1 Tax=Adineta ricciae TaxID=249248 RepID=A0A815U9M5_ADIRI|nr:unnamed protein product [Adineta ricciae]